jgi:hypothetical protein
MEMKLTKTTMDICPLKMMMKQRKTLNLVLNQEEMMIIDKDDIMIDLILEEEDTMIEADFKEVEVTGTLVLEVIVVDGNVVETVEVLATLVVELVEAMKCLEVILEEVSDHMVIENNILRDITKKKEMNSIITTNLTEDLQIKEVPIQKAIINISLAIVEEAEIKKTEKDSECLEGQEVLGDKEDIMMMTMNTLILEAEETLDKTMKDINLLTEKKILREETKQENHFNKERVMKEDIIKMKTLEVEVEEHIVEDFKSLINQEATFKDLEAEEEVVFTIKIEMNKEGLMITTKTGE